MFITGCVFLGIFALFSGTHLFFCYVENEKLRKITKTFCLALLSIASFFFLYDHPFIYLGALMGMIGDYFLLKKNHLVAFVLGVLFFFIGTINVHAIDLNLINTVRENEINSAGNLNSSTNNNTQTNSINLSGNGSLISNSTGLNNTQFELPSTNVSNVIGTESESLSIGNILNILLIVVGVLLVFLGIAIIIRINR